MDNDIASYAAKFGFIALPPEGGVPAPLAEEGDAINQMIQRNDATASTINMVR